ncbi:MAG: vitamin B12 dependent-methionine synthase activation domain-containing protein [Dehalococcoidales bacterium]|nr:vitamin B12 dependent-methionine synthase activation domain-containing protein [Dehalococcoidales bacterium]
MEILDHLPVELSEEKILKKLRAKPGNETIERGVRELLDMVRPVVNARAVYECSYVEDKQEDSVLIRGTRFTSRVLRVNLDNVGRVFPYVVTCGREADALKAPENDVMSAFLLDAIKESVVQSASRYLREYIVKKYVLGQVSTMAPGSLKDWPITQQKELFSVFGNVEELIGVRLTPSFLMTPIKSVSGIMFPTEVRFESCQLCPRESCVGRRAPHNPELAKKYGENVIGNVADAAITPKA